MNDITFDTPVTIKFMPAQVQIIIQALNEVPYRIAQPLIESIMTQVREQVEKPKVDDPPA
jgi:hypothetical protein